MKFNFLWSQVSEQSVKDTVSKLIQVINVDTIMHIAVEKLSFEMR